MNKHTEFLKFIVDICSIKAEKHRALAKDFSRKGLNDAKYHDGMADMAIVLSIQFQEMFGEELK